MHKIGDDFVISLNNEETPTGLTRINVGGGDPTASDTLIVNGALHDIVSKVPPQDVGRSEVWLRTVGEATLIIELRDSLSNEVIYRAVERRAIATSGQQMTRAHTATTWAEVRRWARRWAVRLREGLDSVHQ